MTKTVKVADLIGAELDLAVAMAERNEPGETHLEVSPYFKPSTEWRGGGPIIEREKILLAPLEHGGWRAVHLPSGDEGPLEVIGRLEEGDEEIEFTAPAPTVAIEAKYPLLAAMRCYVASKFGDTVELP